MNLGIIGTGGFAREVLQLALDIQKTDNQFNEINFVMFDDFFEHEFVDEIKVIKISNCNFKNTKIIIATADPASKKRILNKLPAEVTFTSLISPLAFIANDFKHEEGLVIMPFTYVSCNVKLGKHVHLNSHCTVGHDTSIGDYSTTACSVMISGDNNISESCYFGMNSSTRQGISICKNVTVGLNAGVLKDITSEGSTYFGSPARRIK